MVASQVVILAEMTCCRVVSHSRFVVQLGLEILVVMEAKPLLRCRKRYVQIHVSTDGCCRCSPSVRFLELGPASEG